MKIIKNKARVIIATVGLLGISICSILSASGSSHLLSGQIFKRPLQSEPQYLINERTNIVATWISEEDGKSKWIFAKNGICYWYYSKNLVSTFTYSLSNTTPQCGSNVLVDTAKKTSYLQLTDSMNHSRICYEINGVGKVLSLMALNSGKTLIFNRQ